MQPGQVDNKQTRGRSGSSGRARVTLCLLLLPLAFPAGCTRDFRYQPLGMWNEARLKPYEGSPMPNESSSSRGLVPGAVARGELWTGDPMATGRYAGKPLAKSPVAVTRALLQRGQERFNISCSPCHGRLGDGQGMIVQRGFPHPPDYAIPRLRKAPVGHFYDVITNGYGVMYSYAQSVAVKDRWAIASYIRVLQKTRPVVPVDLYEQERKRARESAIIDPVRGMRLPEGESPPGSAQGPPGSPAPAPGGSPQGADPHGH